eukprot:jgi/Mesvir1/27993/Mv20191-RA.1
MGKCLSKPTTNEGNAAAPSAVNAATSKVNEAVRDAAAAGQASAGTAATQVTAVVSEAAAKLEKPDDVVVVAKEAGAAAVEAGKKVAGDAVAAAQASLTGAKAATEGGIASTSEAVSSAADETKDAIDASTSGATEAATDAVSEVQTAAGQATSAAEQATSSAVDTAVAAAKDVTDGVKGVVAGAAATATTAATSAGEQASGVVSEVVETVAVTTKDGVAAVSTAVAGVKGGKKNILILYYSTRGHVLQLAEAMADAVHDAGANPKIMQVPETLTEEQLANMSAPPKAEYPVASPVDLEGVDGILFGFPARFGIMSSQMKAFWDSTGALWKTGALVGKPGAFFTSTALQASGQESSHWMAITQLVHHGMLYVPLGYSTPDLFNLDEVKGGSPYGASTLAGMDATRQVTELELRIAKHQATSFTKFVERLSA